MKTLTAALGLAIVGAWAGAAADPHSPAERAIHYRHSVYHVIEWNVSLMGDQIKGATPYDPKDFAMRASRVAALVPMLPEGFPPGSYLAGKTLAKPAVFSERAEFDSRLNKLATRSQALASAAAAGTLDSVRAPFNDLVATCKDCHTKFKEKGGHSPF
jgi:cytochrome c556